MRHDNDGVTRQVFVHRGHSQNRVKGYQTGQTKYQTETEGFSEKEESYKPFVKVRCAVMLTP